MTDLFQRAQDVAADKEVVIKLSYLEIYNEQIRDLLSSSPTPPGQGLPLRDSTAPFGQKISVVGLSEHTPSSPLEVLALITEGNKRRTMSPTEANAVSSRSHAVLQVNVTQRPRDSGLTEECTSASLNIIDLAGSERASATRNRGQRMMEGANINRSLLALANCINALCRASGPGKHVPYRDSKLTRLLKFSLGGNCRTVMIVCISPSSEHFEETHKTLKYAASAKSIRTKISQNLINVDRHVESYAKAILELQEQNARLKSLLEQGKSPSSDVDMRKKVELAALAANGKEEMTLAFRAYLAQVQASAPTQAHLQAARLQADVIRSKLASYPDHRGLQEALGLQDAKLRSKELLTASRTLEAAHKTFVSSLETVLRNPKLDESTRDALGNWSAKLQAEAESKRVRARHDALALALKVVVSSATALLLSPTTTAQTNLPRAHEGDWSPLPPSPTASRGDKPRRRMSVSKRSVSEVRRGRRVSVLPPQRTVSYAPRTRASTHRRLGPSLAVDKDEATPCPQKSPGRTPDSSPTKSAMTRRLAASPAAAPLAQRSALQVPRPTRSISPLSPSQGQSLGSPLLKPFPSRTPSRAPSPGKLSRSPSPGKGAMHAQDARPSLQKEDLPPLSSTRKRHPTRLRVSGEKVTLFANPPPGNAAARAASPERKVPASPEHKVARLSAS